MGELTKRCRADALERILAYHTGRYEEARRARLAHHHRHIGLELKFPLVTRAGDAADAGVLDAFWEICREAGWEPIEDSHSGKIVGVRAGAEDNPDFIRTTTGVCVLEFSLAHCGDLFGLQRQLGQLVGLARELAVRTGALLLGLGIQPKTPPGPDLLAKKGRHLFWDEVLPPRSETAHGWPGSVELFTVIADNQVHVEVGLEEATTAVNVLNAVTGPQLALTANSSVWNGRADERHAAVRELFWDWWIGDNSRCGMPLRPFRDFSDYVETIADLRPVFVKREGQYLGLCDYPTFLDYYADPAPRGRPADGGEIEVVPGPEDLDLHDRAFWWDARLSRFGTVESRVSCQQPPGEFLAPAALVLGLVENLERARALLDDYEWELLRQLRVEAAHAGLQAFADHAGPRRLLKDVPRVAEEGLRRRGLGEETFLAPLWARCQGAAEPARQAREAFARGGLAELLTRYAWR